jgi:peptidoglycan hydrolase-like protein with peptidoglycan-binding domain
MSRSYAVLVAALVGVGGLAGAARLISGDAAAVESAGPVVTEPAAAPVVAPATTAAPSPVLVDVDCTISEKLELGAVGPDVTCLESHLLVAGAFTGAPDEVFDEVTDLAVRAFQGAGSLVVDGVVGPQTAKQLGAWSGPDVLPPDPATCPASGRAAVVDRFNQRAWLCDGGAITDTMPITSAITQPDPGTYEVYAKDMNASSTLSGEYSTMTHFVAFTYGKYQGARIAFHSVPQYADGEYVQPLDSVGTEELHGDSSGCIRVLPDDAELIWGWLDIGDTVKVVS